MNKGHLVGLVLGLFALLIIRLMVLSSQVSGLGEQVEQQDARLDALTGQLHDSHRQLEEKIDEQALVGPEALPPPKPDQVELPKKEAEPPSTVSTEPTSTIPGKAENGVAIVGGAKFDVYSFDPRKVALKFYHEIDGEKVRSIEGLQQHLQRQSQRLLFATNGGMYLPDHSPQGLYVEAGKELYPLNMGRGGTSFTNFYSLPPNAVFYITKKGRAGIVPREDYHKVASNVQYATQSAPMAVIKGKINPEFNRNSKSKYIRSGVGIQKNGHLVFAISQQAVTFYEFAQLFLSYKCVDALYLDGAISEMYLPAIGRRETHQNFASILAVSHKK